MRGFFRCAQNDNVEIYANYFRDKTPGSRFAAEGRGRETTTEILTLRVRMTTVSQSDGTEWAWRRRRCITAARVPAYDDG